MSDLMTQDFKYDELEDVAATEPPGSKAFDEFFPGATKYKLYSYSDGTTEMVRIPPDLKLVSNRSQVCNG